MSIPFTYSRTSLSRSKVHSFVTKYVIPATAFVLVALALQVGLRVQVPAVTDSQAREAQDEVSTIVDFIENRLRHGRMDTQDAVEAAGRLASPGLTVAKTSGGGYLVHIETVLDDGWRQIPFSYGYNSHSDVFAEASLEDLR